MKRPDLIHSLKRILREVAPRAEAIVYGSEARGDARPDSDIDLLILLDQNTVTPAEEDAITAPLYDLEYESGVIVSPLVMTRRRWDEAAHRSLFYYNVQKDGVRLQ